jgi:long-chain acyl-CoA synthetase
MDKPWLKSYEPGVSEEIEYPEGMLVHHILEQSAERFPNRPATIFPAPVGENLYEGRLSYRDLENAANRFANALLALGIQKGDRVALILPNSPQFLISYFGALKAGAVVAAFNPIYTPAEIERQLIDCGAETVVTMTKFYPAVKQVQAMTRVTRVIATNIKDYFHPVVSALFSIAREKQEGFRVPLDRRDYSFRLMLRRSTEARPQITLSPDDIALLQYTGGTTGVPKAAILTHRNLVSNCLQSVVWRTEAEPGNEVALCIIPFFHLYGMQIAMLNNVYLGGALILLPKFDARQAVMAIDKYQPSVFPGVPTLYIALLNYPAIDKHNLHSIRVCLSGAAPLPVEVQRSFEALSGGRLVEGYGMTESGPLTHANPIHGTRREGSIGLPVPSTLARIVDPEFPNVELRVGEVGELAIQGPQVFQGYWNCPEDTAKTLVDGWLITGDLARMDEEGFFYIVERKKDMINAGGFKVFPRDVEEVLYKHPKVQEAVVVGINDPYLGEVPKAFIVVKEGETATPEEISEHLNKHLAKYKVPRHIEFRDSLPKTIVGKVLRRQLKEEEKNKHVNA